MTEFIPSFATQQLLPPWKGEAEVYGFAFRLPESSIQVYLDRYFNATQDKERNFQFESVPDGDLCLLLYSKLTNVKTANSSSAAPKTKSWDNLEFREVVVCVPLRRWKVSPQNVLYEPVFQWCKPIAVCDNTTVIFSMRETIGLDVLPGEITETPDLTGGGFTLSVKLHGVTKFAPTAKDGPIELLQVHVIPPTSDGTPLDPNAKDMIKVIESLSGGEVYGGCLPQLMNLVTLKQFRDACNLDVAIYQALVTSLLTRQPKPDGPKKATIVPSKNVTMTVDPNDTTREILQTFLGDRQEPPVPPEVWANVIAPMTPALAFHLDCTVCMNQVTTDFTFS
jgi:hypothetical protein